MQGAGRPVVEVRDLLPDEVGDAVGVLARGMRDNPMNIAMLGGDEEQRERLLVRMFTSLFRVATAQAPLVAIDGETIVGAIAVARRVPANPLSSSRSVGFRWRCHSDRDERNARADCYAASVTSTAARRARYTALCPGAELPRPRLPGTPARSTPRHSVGGRGVPHVWDRG